LLTDEEKTEIMAEISRYPNKRAACVSALKIVQQRRGWVSDEIRDIADILEMSVEELDGVATFFSHIYTRPLGKHLIFICDSISCWVTGYDGLRERLSDRLGIRPGETTPDGQFTLIPIACLGSCDRAPAMMIDETLYSNLDPEKLEEVLGKYE
jgi:NADH-quinone oxidoreductase subunit E